MSNHKKCLQDECVGSCYNIWAHTSIMSSLSTESALYWGFIRIEKMAMIVDSFSFQSSWLPYSKHWWINFAIVPDLIMYLTENYTKHTFQATCCCYERGLTKDLLLFKTINVSID